MALTKLRDWAEQNKLNVGYDPTTKLVTLASPTGKTVSFESGGTAAKTYGVTLGEEGYNYLDPSASPLRSLLGVGEPTPRETYQSEVSDILKQLKSRISEPFTYDPSKDPVYQAILPQIQGKVMEQLNTRNILKSTITRDDLARATAEIIPQLASQAYQRQQQQFSNLGTILSTLMGLESQQYERERQAELDRIAAEQRRINQEQQKLTNAWDRVKSLGYVDNAASVVLGVPVGTPSYEAKNAAEERAQRLQIAREQNAAAMARTQASNAAAMQRLITGRRLEEEANAATNAAIAEVMSYSTKEEALRELQEVAEELAAQGVDISAVLQAINRRWPETYE
ncbi:MAG: hypothetical protein K6T65_11760 [Peptococcaceae bacterium]|nr:hypothetical protein [Peptococcaceae bacterium]